MSSTSEELAAQAEELQTSIAFFKVETSAARRHQTAEKAQAPARPAAKPVAKAPAPAKPADRSVLAQQSRARGFALDLSVGGPDAEDDDFRASA
jgi:methyl-accepting chemotaxis protein